jgi:hypothetical protein
MAVTGDNEVKEAQVLPGADFHGIVMDCIVSRGTRWATMNDEMIIVDALRSNSVSSGNSTVHFITILCLTQYICQAISFLSTRYMDNEKGSDGTPSAQTLRGFSFLGGRYIYKLLCNDISTSLATCIHMLKNLGEGKDFIYFELKLLYIFII